MISRSIAQVQTLIQDFHKQNIRILVVTIMILGGFLASFLFHYYQGQILGKGYPHNTFLFIPTDRFKDFFIVLAVNADRNPYFNDIIVSGQLPFVNVLGYVLSLISPQLSLTIFVVSGSVTFVLLTNAILWEEPHSLLYKLPIVIPMVFLTYPFLFTMDRGNFEILLFLFLLLFLLSFLRRSSTLSAVFLSFAIAMKGFPVLLVLLYLARKQYREFAISITLPIVITLGSLALFRGGLLTNIAFFLGGSNLSAGNLGVFVGSNNIVQRGVTLLTFFKIIFIEAGWIDKINMQHFLSAYIRLAALSFIPVAFYIVALEKVLWKQTALLIFAMLLLPQISADYKLIHVYLPMYLFLISDNPTSIDWIYLLTFSLLMIPKDYAYFPNTVSDSGFADISISVAANIILMILMSAIIIISGLRKNTKAELVEL